MLATGLLLLAFSCSALLAADSENGDLAISFLVAVASYIAYWLVLTVSGFGRRLVPTISAIMAAGSILSILSVLVSAIMRPIVADNISLTIAWLILVWSIPVEGNIIARAIEQHWFAGIAIAMIIFVMQNIAYFYLVSASANS